VAKIALLYPLFVGHGGPARRLGGALVRAGHHVVEFGPDWREANLSPDAGAQDLPASPFPPVDPPHDMVASAALVADGAKLMIGPLSEALLAAAVDVVIWDVGMLGGRIAAELLGLPSLRSHPTFPRTRQEIESDAEAAAPDRARHVARLQRTRDEIWGAWGVDIGDHIDIATNLGDRTIVFTTPEILGDTELGDSYRFVGPLMEPMHNATEPTLAGWGDEPLVYMALGTVFTDRKPLFLSVLEALAELPVRLLMSTWGRFTADDLAPVPANARVAARVNSRAVLREARLQITHGGPSSLHESLLAGVPMLFFPPTRGSARWAACAEAIGAAEVQSDHSANAIRAAVERLLTDDTTQRRAGELARSLAAYDGMAVAVQAVDEVLTPV
jgi:MGT family glycosyltransferase